MSRAEDFGTQFVPTAEEEFPSSEANEQDQELEDQELDNDHDMHGDSVGHLALESDHQQQLHPDHDGQEAYSQPRNRALQRGGDDNPHSLQHSIDSRVEETQLGELESDTQAVNHALPTPTQRADQNDGISSSSRATPAPIHDMSDPKPFFTRPNIPQVDLHGFSFMPAPNTVSAQYSRPVASRSIFTHNTPQQILPANTPANSSNLDMVQPTVEGKYQASGQNRGFFPDAHIMEIEAFAPLQDAGPSSNSDQNQTAQNHTEVLIQSDTAVKSGHMTKQYRRTSNDLHKSSKAPEQKCNPLDVDRTHKATTSHSVVSDESRSLGTQQASTTPAVVSPKPQELSAKLPESLSKSTQITINNFESEDSSAGGQRLPAQVEIISGYNEKKSKSLQQVKQVKRVIGIPFPRESSRSHSKHERRHGGISRSKKAHNDGSLKTPMNANFQADHNMQCPAGTAGTAKKGGSIVSTWDLNGQSSIMNSEVKTQSRNNSQLPGVAFIGRSSTLPIPNDHLQKSITDSSQFAGDTQLPSNSPTEAHVRETGFLVSALAQEEDVSADPAEPISVPSRDATNTEYLKVQLDHEVHDEDNDQTLVHHDNDYTMHITPEAQSEQPGQTFQLDEVYPTICNERDDDRSEVSLNYHEGSRSSSRRSNSGKALSHVLQPTNRNSQGTHHSTSVVSAADAKIVKSKANNHRPPCSRQQMIALFEYNEGLAKKCDEQATQLEKEFQDLQKLRESNQTQLEELVVLKSKCQAFTSENRSLAAFKDNLVKENAGLKERQQVLDERQKTLDVKIRELQDKSAKYHKHADSLVDAHNGMIEAKEQLKEKFSSFENQQLEDTKSLAKLKMGFQILSKNALNANTFVVKKNKKLAEEIGHLKKENKTLSTRFFELADLHRLESCKKMEKQKNVSIEELEKNRKSLRETIKNLRAENSELVIQGTLILDRQAASLKFGDVADIYTVEREKQDLKDMLEKHKGDLRNEMSKAEKLSSDLEAEKKQKQGYDKLLQFFQQLPESVATKVGDKNGDLAKLIASETDSRVKFDQILSLVNNLKEHSPEPPESLIKIIQELSNRLEKLPPPPQVGGPIEPNETSKLLQELKDGLDQLQNEKDNEARLNTTIAELQQANDKLQTETKDMDKVTRDLSICQEELHKTKAELVSAAAVHSNGEKQLQAKIQELENRVASAQSSEQIRIQDLKAQISTKDNQLETKTQDLEKKIQELSELGKSSSKELTELQKASDEKLSELRGSSSQKLSELQQSSDKKLSELHGSKKELEKELANATAKIQSFDDEKQKYMAAQKEENQKECVDLAKKAEATKQSLETKLNSQIQNQDQRNKELATELATVKKQLEELRAFNATRENNESRIQSEIAAYKDAFAPEVAKLEEMVGRNTTSEDSNDQSMSLESTFVEITNLRELLQSVKADTDRSVESWGRELTSVESTVRQFDDLQQRNEGLEAKNTNLQKSLGTLKAKLANYEEREGRQTPMGGSDTGTPASMVMGPPKAKPAFQPGYSSIESRSTKVNGTVSSPYAMNSPEDTLRINIGHLNNRADYIPSSGTRGHLRLAERKSSRPIGPESEFGMMSYSNGHDTSYSGTQHTPTTKKTSHTPTSGCSSSSMTDLENMVTEFPKVTNSFQLQKEYEKTRSAKRSRNDSSLASQHSFSVEQATGQVRDLGPQSSAEATEMLYRLPGDEEPPSKRVKAVAKNPPSAAERRSSKPGKSAMKKTMSHGTEIITTTSSTTRTLMFENQDSSQRRLPSSHGDTADKQRRAELGPQAFRGVVGGRGNPSSSTAPKSSSTQLQMPASNRPPRPQRSPIQPVARRGRRVSSLGSSKQAVSTTARKPVRLPRNAVIPDSQENKF